MISYVAALLTAVANASSNVLNRKATREEPQQVEFRVRLILDLLRRRIWLIAVAVMLVSFLTGAVALGTGQLAAVQIIIILELPLTLLGAAKFLGGRLGAREWAAIAGMTGGVIGLLALLDPRPGPSPAISPGKWIIGSAATAAPAAVFFVMARRTRRPARRAALLGLATGLAYGLAATYTKGLTGQFTREGIAGALASWQLYAAGAAGIAATWLLQNAYHAGRLAAAQPGITLIDPAAATAWGISVFGERVRDGLFLALTPLPVIVLVVSVFMLSRSPVLQSSAGAGEPARDTLAPAEHEHVLAWRLASRWLAGRFGERAEGRDQPGPVPGGHPGDDGRDLAAAAAGHVIDDLLPGAGEPEDHLTPARGIHPAAHQPGGDQPVDHPHRR